MTSRQPEARLERALAKRRTLQTDLHRPSIHLTAPSGWLNDPNGVIQWEGEYHLFYQHNPLEAKWGPPHWGHAVSADLVHWRDRPVALTPDMPPIDGGGCWSGCMVDDDGTPTIVYTGVKDNHQGEQTTCLAFGDDTLTHWRKYEGNPVARAPSDLGITHRAYRDPYVWKEDGVWYQVLGTSLGGRGQALLYQSQDLRTWDFLNPLLDQEAREALDDVCHTWECTNFFRLGDKHVLLVALATEEALAYPLFLIGDYEDFRFQVEAVQRVDWGYHCFYAPLTMVDDGGRRLMWGWLQEQRSAEAQLAAGWSGVMSLPRVLALEENKVHTRFAPELEDLRQQELSLEGVLLEDTLPLALEGGALELQVTLRRDKAARAGLSFRYAPEEILKVTVGWDNKQLTLDRQGLGIEPKMVSPCQSAEFAGLGDTVSLHLYLDSSALELIADGHLAMSARLYPSQGANVTTELFAEKGAARIEKLEAWTLKNIWSTSEARGPQG